MPIIIIVAFATNRSYTVRTLLDRFHRHNEGDNLAI